MASLLSRNGPRPPPHVSLPAARLRVGSRHNEGCSLRLVSLGSSDHFGCIEVVDVLNELVGEYVLGIDLLLDHLLIGEPIVVSLIVGAHTFSPSLDAHLVRIEAPGSGSRIEQL